MQVVDNVNGLALRLEEAGFGRVIHREADAEVFNLEEVVAVSVVGSFGVVVVVMMLVRVGEQMVINITDRGGVWLWEHPDQQALSWVPRLRSKGRCLLGMRGIGTKTYRPLVPLRMRGRGVSLRLDFIPIIAILLNVCLLPVQAF